MTIKTDTIAEYTAATGVTIDGALLKDGQLQGTAPLLADTISEKTAAAGVTVDGMLLKDGGATLIEPLVAQEETAAAANPGAGYRKLYPRDFGGWAERDDGGYEHALAWATGTVVNLPKPSAIAETKAGTFSDTDTDADGFLGVDRTNNRVYFRAGATWYWLPRSTIVALLDGSQAFTGQQTFDAGLKADTISEKTATTGVTIDGALLKDGGATLIEPLIAQEETAAAANPAAGYRKLYPRDFGGWAERDDGGYEHAVAWAGGNVAALIDEPTPAMWQHKNAATGSSYGALRIECGRDTLAAGTCAITFQKAFTTILEVFLQDKTAANAMYPSSPATSGFTANGTGTDTFAWLAIGAD